MTADKRAPEAVAVLDMGASAVRLVIAEVAAGRSVRVVEEASRGVLLGRDTFSGGVIRPKTADATFAALEGFRHIIDTYRVQRIRAVATSAVREARNSELFLDRVRGRTGIAFDIINGAEESRLVYLAGHVHRSVRTAAGDPPGGGRRVTPPHPYDASLFINRELSWLAFNERVLE
jgi:exopolyphosphatase/guanosine-5'-triphosphate,3'-diphosphate pyrophosphatase